jgi:hypothetical protein
MKPLTQYGRLAEEHWRRFLPRMTAQLETQGQLHVMLLAEERTEAGLDSLRRHFIALMPDELHARSLITGIEIDSE